MEGNEGEGGGRTQMLLKHPRYWNLPYKIVKTTLLGSMASAWDCMYQGFTGGRILVYCPNALWQMCQLVKDWKIGFSWKCIQDIVKTALNFLLESFEGNLPMSLEIFGVYFDNIITGKVQMIFGKISVLNPYKKKFWENSLLMLSMFLLCVVVWQGHLLCWHVI